MPQQYAWAGAGTMRKEVARSSAATDSLVQVEKRRMLIVMVSFV
jgi:hypothetical protein